MSRAEQAAEERDSKDSTGLDWIGRACFDIPPQLMGVPLECIRERGPALIADRRRPNPSVILILLWGGAVLCIVIVFLRFRVWRACSVVAATAKHSRHHHRLAMAFTVRHDCYYDYNYNYHYLLPSMPILSPTG